MQPRSRNVLALLLLALISGPVLLSVAVSSAPVAYTAWSFPEELTLLSDEIADRLRPDVPAPTERQVAVLRDEQRLFEFYRLHYQMANATDDLVPWHSSLYHKGWIRTSQRSIKKQGIKLNLLTLENIATEQTRALAYVYRVGNYTAAPFNLAKLLQIPAKLQGNAQFDILMLTADCNSDCANTGPALATALAAIVASNSAL